MKSSIQLAATLILLLAAADASAQTFHLKNGETLTAEVKREADDFYIIRGADGSNVVLLKSKLARIPEKPVEEPVEQPEPYADAGYSEPAPLPPAEYDAEPLPAVDAAPASSFGRSLDSKPPARPAPPAPPPAPAPVEETSSWPAEQEETEFSEPEPKPQDPGLPELDAAEAPALPLLPEVEPAEPERLPSPTTSSPVWKNKAEPVPADERDASALVAETYIWTDGIKNYDKALAIQKVTKRPFVLYFYTNWSPECKKFKKAMLNDPAVKKALEPAVKVSINADVEKRLAAQYGAKDVPAFLLIFPDGRSTPVRTDLEKAAFLTECEGLGLPISSR